MQTFITKHNSSKLVFEMDKVDVDINQEIFRIDFIWFGDYEIKEILAFKQLYKDPDNFFKYYKKRKPVDTKTYVYEGKYPAYHKESDCPRLTSSFTNVRIPEEIKKRGDEEIQKFRNWYKENSYLLENDKIDIFLERMRLRFNLERVPEQVDYDNSGVESHESLELDELDLRIERLISNANDFYLRSYKNTTILDNFGKISFIYKGKKPPYNNNTQYSNEEIWEVLKDFEENYKANIKHLLKEYYRIKYNPELEFDGTILDQLGFQKCGYCFGRVDVDSFLDYLDDDLPF